MLRKGWDSRYPCDPNVIHPGDLKSNYRKAPKSTVWSPKSSLRLLPQQIGLKASIASRGSVSQHCSVLYTVSRQLRNSGSLSASKEGRGKFHGRAINQDSGKTLRGAKASTFRILMVSWGHHQSCFPLAAALIHPGLTSSFKGLLSLIFPPLHLSTPLPLRSENNQLFPLSYTDHLCSSSNVFIQAYQVFHKGYEEGFYCQLWK